MSSYVHQGKKLGGVWNKTDKGPDGTKIIEVWSVGTDSIERIASLADNETATMEDMQTVHEQALKRVCPSTHTTKDGTYRVSGLRVGRTTVAEDEDCDDAVIDSVFNRRRKKGKTEDEDCETSTTPSACQGEGTAGTASSSNAAKRNKSTPPEEMVKVERLKTGTRWTKATVSKALDESDQVALKGTQHLTLFEDAGLIISITVKSHDAVIGVVNKRLLPDLVTMYTAKVTETGEVLSEVADPDSRGIQK